MPILVLCPPHIWIFSFSEGNGISGGPRSKLERVINCFVWWPIFASIAGQGQAHKSLKDEPDDCGLSCHCCCPGDHRVLPVEILWWIKSHHWHAEGLIAAGIRLPGSHRLEWSHFSDSFDGFTWNLQVITYDCGNDGSLASCSVPLQLSCDAQVTLWGNWNSFFQGEVCKICVYHLK